MIGGRGRVFDTSAIIDAATGRTVYARALVVTAAEVGLVICVPAAALAKAWVSLPEADWPFLDLLSGRSVVVVDALDASTAAQVGQRGQRPWLDGVFDLADLQVVHSGLRRAWPVVTADPDPLRAIEPGLAVEELPA